MARGKQERVGGFFATVEEAQEYAATPLGDSGAVIGQCTYGDGDVHEHERVLVLTSTGQKVRHHECHTLGKATRA